MRKPRIKIELTKGSKYPVIFHVKWPGNHWKNSRWHTFAEAVHAAVAQKA